MIPVLALPCDPHAAGYTHGRALAREIRENLALYRERLEKAYGMSFQEGLRRARFHLERLSAWAPEYRSGLVGLAEGAGLALEEAALLDARYELFYAEFAKEECTAFVLRPPKAETMVLAQNWDWIPGVRGAWLRYGASGPRVLAFTEAGIFGGKIGLNAEGFGICLTGLVSPEDRWDGEGVPLHARVWQALQARNLSEAQEILSRTPSPCSAGFILGNGENALCVELSPSRSVTVRVASDGFAHANHFLFLPWQAGASADLENSRARQARAEELLASLPLCPIPDVLEVLGDHQGFPHSICRHPDGTLPAWERWATNFSVVLLPRTREVLFTWGPSCSALLQKLSLAENRGCGGASA